MICVDCGAENRDIQSFCRKCGYNLQNDWIKAAKTKKILSKNTLLYNTTSPFSTSVMDADFAYSTKCIEAIREYAEQLGFPLTDVSVNLVINSELDHGGTAKANDERRFEIRRNGERTIASYITRITIRRNRPDADGKTG